jgi:hypothetical protein
MLHSLKVSTGTLYITTICTNTNYIEYPTAVLTTLVTVYSASETAATQSVSTNTTVQKSRLVPLSNYHKLSSLAMQFRYSSHKKQTIGGPESRIGLVF